MTRSHPTSWTRWRVLFVVSGVVFLLSFLSVFAGAIDLSAYFLHLPVVNKALPASWDGRLLISEVMIDPVGREPDGEWFAIYNSGRTEIDLTGFKIGDAWNKGDKEGMLRFPPGTKIGSEKVLVIAHRGDVFFQMYGKLPDLEMFDSLQEVEDMWMYLEWANRIVELSNNGDEVLILNETDEIADALSWGASHLALSPPAPRAPEGCTLERYPYYVDTNSARDWRIQCNPVPGVVDYTPPTPTSTLIPTPTLTGTPTPTGTATPTPTLTPTTTQSSEPVDPTETLIPTPAFTFTPVPVLIINEIHAHPHPNLGDANGDGEVGALEDQFIELVNASSFPALLEGWSIWNSEGIQHIFYPGTVVPPGGAILIFGGGFPEGEFGGSQWQLAVTGGLFLNMCGDTVSVYDALNNLAASYTYGPEGCSFQSITRFPDATGPDPLIPHSTHPGASEAIFSPGTQASGDPFPIHPLIASE
jgi:hypothetical protein